MKDAQPNDKKSEAELELEVNWSIAEKWFRLIEFALVLGVLSFFAENLDEKIGRISFRLIYLISAVVIWAPIGDLCVLITKELTKGKSRKFRITVLVVISGVALGFWLLLLNMTSLIAETSFK